MDVQNIAQELRKKADILIKAAEVLEGKMDSNQIQFPIPSPAIFQAPSSIPIQNSFIPKSSIPAVGTRKDQLISLLKKHGAMTMNEIVNTGIPKGTASAVMTEANGFKRDQFGKWILTLNK